MSSHQSLIIKLFCLVTLWGAVGWLFASPTAQFGVSYQALIDFFINEKWLEPPTQWPNSDSIEHPGPGRDVMANSNVTFLGVGRNLGDGLPKVLKQIENLAARFQYSRAIFVEGGSTDDTSLQLKNWVKSSIVNRTVITMPSNITYEKSGNFKGIKLPREGRLADARNVGLKELYRLEKTG
jgi:hypothetical protein